MKEKIEQLIADLKSSHNFESEFYQAYLGIDSEADITDWADGHWDDAVELGFRTGKTAKAQEVINQLEAILKGETK